MKWFMFCVAMNFIAAIVLIGAGATELNNLGTSVPALLCVAAGICGLGEIRKNKSWNCNRLLTGRCRCQGTQTSGSLFSQGGLNTIRKEKTKGERNMTVIGNILWFLFGGLIGGLAWVLAGCLWCVTIIGIPVGLQCFKFASLDFFPFGKEVIYGGGGFSFLVNLIWIVFFGFELAIGYVILGCLWCITLLGIPIGKQCFKMAKLSLMPFGASVI